MTIFFYFFASLLIFSALMVVITRHPIHAVLWLIFTFCNAAGLTILIGAEFIAMILVIVYVGAVAVLFLFVIMMLNIKFEKAKNYSFMQILFYSLISLLFFANLIFVILLATKTINPMNIENQLTILANTQNVHHIGQVLYTDFILSFQTCGIILFTAMIACISLTLSKDQLKNKQLHQQKIKAQLARTKENSVKIAQSTGQHGLENLNYDN